MDKEKYFALSGIKGQIQNVIAKETAKALTDFCGQEPEFEQAVEQSGKIFQECLDCVAKRARRTGISDNDAYEIAAQFYFPTATVRSKPVINLCGEVETETAGSMFDSLLDF